MGSPRCNNADIDWKMRMPTNSPLIDLKVEMPIQLCEKEDTVPEPNLPMTENQLPIKMGRYECWNKSKTIPVN